MVCSAEGCSVTQGDMSAARLMQQLEKVSDPCSIALGRAMSLPRIGLIEEVSLENGVARVVLCLTDPACINYGSLVRYITDVLLELDAVDAVEVSQTTRTLWTPDRVRSEGPC
jgi:metal-sulfur cluster biosynthetic enzyme